MGALRVRQRREKLQGRALPFPVSQRWLTAHLGSALGREGRLGPPGALGPGLTAPPPPQKRYRAVYDYSAADEDEVSFQDGDTIVNVQQIDDGWMYGTVERTGDTGMLPANYVEAI